MDATLIVRIVAGLLVVCVMIPVVLIPYWVIFKKAGFSPWISLLMIFPVVSLIVLYVVAFTQWKVQPIPNSTQTDYPPMA